VYCLILCKGSREGWTVFSPVFCGCVRKGRDSGRVTVHGYKYLLGLESEWNPWEREMH
jgi:hypothetical protein